MRHAILSALVLALVACGPTPRDPVPDPEPADAGPVCVAWTGPQPPSSICWNGGYPVWHCVYRRFVCE